MNVIDKNICGHCNNRCTDVGKESDALFCDYCGHWVHAACEGMDNETYRTFNKLTKTVPNMSYYCNLNSCKLVSGEILKQLGPIRQRVDENTQRIEALEDTVKAQNMTIEMKVADEVALYVQETIKEEVGKRFEVEKDRADRSCNVIIQNVKEASVGDSQARKDWDAKFVSDLLRNSLELDIADKIKHVIRLGRYEASSERPNPRLIKVIFDKEESATRVLRSAGKLRDIRDNALKEIKIFRDLSPSDREKRKALVVEMKAKNDELKKGNVLDSKFIIRGDKLVKVKIDASKQGSTF